MEKQSRGSPHPLFAAQQCYAVVCFYWTTNGICVLGMQPWVGSKHKSTGCNSTIQSRVSHLLLLLRPHSSEYNSFSQFPNLYSGERNMIVSSLEIMYFYRQRQGWANIHQYVKGFYKVVLISGGPRC